MYATMGDQCVKKKKLVRINLNIKLRLLIFFTDVTDFDNEQKCTSVS